MGVNHKYFARNAQFSGGSKGGARDAPPGGLAHSTPRASLSGDAPESLLVAYYLHPRGHPWDSRALAHECHGIGVFETLQFTYLLLGEGLGCSSTVPNGMSGVCSLCSGYTCAGAASCQWSCYGSAFGQLAGLTITTTRPLQLLDLVTLYTTNQSWAVTWSKGPHDWGLIMV